jgi:two-component system, NtrC family, response regulator PilR
MQNHSFTVLILEDYLPVTKTITAAIQAAHLPCEVMAAKNVAEAQELMSTVPFDLIISDINLPDGNGIDFLCDAAMIHPDAKVIIMTATPYPEYKTQAEELGVVRFLEKPLDTQRVVDFVAELLGIPRRGGEQGTDRFNASIGRLSPIEVIECAAGASAVLRFTAGTKEGRVAIADGEIIHAETGCLIGRGAFYEMMSWENGHVSREIRAVEERHTIVSEWRSLIADARANSKVETVY